MILHSIAVISLFIAFISAVIITIDILKGNRQQMMVMNFVYPITALYGSIFALLFYYYIGRNSGIKKNNPVKTPLWQSVAKGALHCGSGCTLGDISAEILLLYFPVVIFGSKLAGTWTVDYIFAFIIGIIFQYYAIKPMRDLSATEAIRQRLKPTRYH